MSAELWGSAGGVNRKLTELCAPVDGVNRKLKELWAVKDGVNRKIFNAYDCKGHNYYSGLNTLGADGSFSTSYLWEDNDKPTDILFYLQFDNPIQVSSFTINSFSYDSTDGLQGLFRINLCGSADGSSEVAYYSAENVSGIHGNMTLHISGSTAYSILYFLMSVTTSHGKKISWPAGGMYINGKQIKSIELI